MQVPAGSYWGSAMQAARTISCGRLCGVCPARQVVSKHMLRTVARIPQKSICHRPRSHENRGADSMDGRLRTGSDLLV